MKELIEFYFKERMMINIDELEKLQNQLCNMTEKILFQLKFDISYLTLIDSPFPGGQTNRVSW